MSASRVLRSVSWGAVTGESYASIAIKDRHARTGDSAHQPGFCVRLASLRHSRRLTSSAEKDSGTNSPSHSQASS